MRAGYCIDASNLHAGGAIQVAVSFIEDFYEIWRRGELAPTLTLEGVDIYVSKEVHAQLAAATHDLPNLHVVRRSLVGRLLRGARNSISRTRYAARFVVFGFDYAPRQAHSLIMGFADGTSLDPVTSRSSPRARLRSALSRFGFRRSNVVIAESEAVASQLREVWDIKHVAVVPNSLNRVFHSAERPQFRPITERGPMDSPLVAGYAARAYPHKNHDLLGEVAEILRSVYNINMRIRCTLTKEEWEARSERFRRNAQNVGPVHASSLPAFYESLDLGIFPSLLESFSTTPLEVLHSGIPLFASDRKYVRDHVKNAAFYFDPLDPQDAAQAIAQAIAEPQKQYGKYAEATVLTSLAWSSMDRARAYLMHLAGAPSATRY